MRKKKLVEPDAPTSTAWEVEVYFHTDVPTIRQYQVLKVHLKEEKITGLTVVVYGHQRFIPSSINRKFFTQLPDLQTWLRNYLEHRLSCLRSAVEKICKVLDDGVDLNVSIVAHKPVPPMAIEL